MCVCIHAHLSNSVDCSTSVCVELLGYTLFLVEVKGGVLPCTIDELRQDFLGFFCFFFLFSFIILNPFSTRET